MDSERFDRWAKLLALRMSRRTAATAVGAATVASLASPKWVLGQDDDDDQDTDDDQNTGDDQDDDLDQHKDNPTGEDPDDDDLDSGICQPLTHCVRQICRDEPVTPDSPACQSHDVGPIPGGPYEQKWVWEVPPCTAKDITFQELEAKCNAAYPGDDFHGCNNECSACADVSLAFCH